ncbi:hypothetical protein JD969_19250 [Planctomycetota bacterium]|nr:hypothetical protein JD969_19250 [Planctomycetota bacterium]
MDISRDNPFGDRGNRSANEKRLIVVSRQKNGTVKVLLDHLKERGAEVHEVREVADAMVLVGGYEVDGIVLVDPDELVYVEELMGALERYRPNVLCWGYEEGTGLQPMNGEKVEVVVEENEVGTGFGDEGESRVLVSLEEIEMLLGPCGDEAEEEATGGW